MKSSSLLIYNLFRGFVYSVSLLTLYYRAKCYNTVPARQMDLVAHEKIEYILGCPKFPNWNSTQKPY